MRRRITGTIALVGYVLLMCLMPSNGSAAVVPDPQIMADLQSVFENQFQVEGYPYQESLAAAAQQYNLPLPFVLAVVRGESFFDPTCKSSKGALGLMQVLPSTAADYGVTADTLLDPTRNIDVGVHFLADLYANLKDPYLTLGAYYCGCKGVDKENLTLRKDCDEYVRYIHTHLKKVLANGAAATEIATGKRRSFVLTGFDNFLDAENFLSYLTEVLPQRQLDLFRREVTCEDHLRYQYQIIATYTKDSEKDAICRSVEKATGFSFCR